MARLDRYRIGIPREFTYFDIACSHLLTIILFTELLCYPAFDFQIKKKNY